MPVATPVSKRKKELDSEIVQKENELTQFTKNNPFTGAINDDIGKLLATRQTREGLAAAKKNLNDENSTAAILRGQDLDHEINLSQVDIAKEKNDIDWDKLNVTRDEINVNKLAVDANNNKTAVDRELGLGELDLNKSIFNQTAERYRKYGEPADIMNLTEKAASAKAGVDSLGLKLGDEAFANVNRFVQGDGVAKPTQPMLEESDTMYNKVPEQFSEPVTGIPTASNESRGVSPIFQAANLGVMLGKQINRAATPPRSSLRRRVKKVQ